MVFIVIVIFIFLPSIHIILSDCIVLHIYIMSTILFMLTQYIVSFNHDWWSDRPINDGYIIYYTVQGNNECQCIILIIFY